jgi:hypothetical protein
LILLDPFPYNVDVVRRACILFPFLLFAVFLFAEEPSLLNADFDHADLLGWKLAGDVCVAPSFCGGEPAGTYWIAMSTNSEEDSITMCGSNSVGGVESLLRTPDLALPANSTKVRIDFKMKFLTNESTSTDLGNDSLIVRLLTSGGPVIVAAFDDSGAAPDSRNLTIRGDSSFHVSKCSPTWKYESGMLQVSYYRSFREPFRKQMVSGPVALEFSLSNHFDKNFDSAVLIDDVQVRALK